MSRSDKVVNTVYKISVKNYFYSLITKNISYSRRLMSLSCERGLKPFVTHDSIEKLSDFLTGT